MSNFTVWFDTISYEDDYTKVWCIQGSLSFGFWVAEDNTAYQIEAAINDVCNPLDLDSMGRYPNIVSHGGFETVEEALGYIRMQQLLE